MAKLNESISVWRLIFGVLFIRAPRNGLTGWQQQNFGTILVLWVGTRSSRDYEILADWLQERDVMIAVVKQHLHRAKHRMKKQVDKGRTERMFAVGESVFLKLQPYVQSSLAPRSNQKLAFKFFGPFQIVAKCGSVAYTRSFPSIVVFIPPFMSRN
ncbi:hypothetical protein U9M48_018269 [Paspalum notatum var. saurae]|uniref:Tf2-1-like SH3-like domain-containing protein n=1 Tax=Paspalum notatum var. saurae TaxID=547442 RepID=A0AAQ3T950_PASNO